MVINLSQSSQRLVTRELAQKIFHSMDITSPVTVDFKGVKEATPSFCHEMFEILINELKCKVKVINADESIKFQINKALMTFKKS